MPKSMRNYQKKNMLGTSDAWSTSHSSQRTSEPAYYIVDCQISIVNSVSQVIGFLLWRVKISWIFGQTNTEKKSFEFIIWYLKSRII
jgi:hypothetical protein